MSASPNHPPIHTPSDHHHHNPAFDLASAPKQIESFLMGDQIVEKLMDNINEHIFMKRIRAIMVPHVTEQVLG